MANGLMTKNEASGDWIEKVIELANVDLDTEKFLASHLHQLDYFQDNDIFKRVYKHLSSLRESPSWRDFWRSCISAPSSNWQISLPISKIAPSKYETVWFLVELTTISYHPIFEGTVEIVETVANQIRLLEYYVISKEFTWVIAKSRHDEMFVSGEIVESNLLKLNNIGKS
jgi:hypothetical protein